jgi:hypothetical protein
VLLEAMASGRPIVCSDIAGYRDTVGQQGAVLVPPGDAQALETAIAHLFTHREALQRMGERNRARARLYEWNVVAGRMRTVYLQALERRAIAFAPRVTTIGSRAPIAARAKATVMLSQAARLAETSDDSSLVG